MKLAVDAHASLFRCCPLEQTTDGTHATYGTYVTEGHISPRCPLGPIRRSGCRRTTTPGPI